MFDAPRAGRVGFHSYLRNRKYDFGRGNAASWRFIAVALGDPHLPDATGWRELHEYLRAGNAPLDLIEAARTVWRSYQRNAPRRYSPALPPPGRTAALQPDSC